MALATQATAFDFPLPRIRHVPVLARRRHELADEALYLVGEAGLILDPWEEYALVHSLRLRDDDRWGALEVGLCVPRQNGKGSILEARELVGLFINNERWPSVAAPLVVHSAHQAQTSHEGYERLADLILGCPRLKSKIKGRPRASEGSEAMVMRDGRRIRFRTRTSAGARGLSGDLLIFDEAMVLAETIHRAVWPIVTARPNPQVWYTGSAVDQNEPLMGDHGVVFSRVRQRGMQEDEDLLYFEWSHDAPHPELVTEAEARDPEVWRRANPNLDVRLSRRVIAVEQRSLSARGFAVERLGVGDWPDPSLAGKAIDPSAWGACEDSESELIDPVCLAVDVTPDRAKACIAAAGRRRDGIPHVEVIRQGRGTAWVGSMLSELTSKQRPLAIVLDARGGAGALIQKLEDDWGLRVMEGRGRGGVVPITSTEMARGCGIFYDAVDQQRLRHLGDPKLDAAVAGASKRTLGNAWAWDNKKSAADISPLVAVTLALWGLTHYRARPASVVSLADVEEEQAAEPFDETGLPGLSPEDLD